MMEGVVSKSGKKLSTFEFERQNIAGCYEQTFSFQFNTKLIQSKTGHTVILKYFNIKE